MEVWNVGMVEDCNIETNGIEAAFNNRFIPLTVSSWLMAKGQTSRLHDLTTHY